MFKPENRLISGFTLIFRNPSAFSRFHLISKYCVQVSWGNFRPKSFITFGHPLILVKLHSTKWFLPYLGPYMWHLQLPYYYAVVSYARRLWQMEMWKWLLLKLPFRREMLQMSLKCSCHKDRIYQNYGCVRKKWIVDIRLPASESQPNYILFCVTFTWDEYARVHHERVPLMSPLDIFRCRTWALLNSQAVRDVFQIIQRMVKFLGTKGRPGNGNWRKLLRIRFVKVSRDEYTLWWNEVDG